jgi:hypothetical protein
MCLAICSHELEAHSSDIVSTPSIELSPDKCCVALSRWLLRAGKEILQLEGDLHGLVAFLDKGAMSMSCSALLSACKHIHEHPYKSSTSKSSTCACV